MKIFAAIVLTYLVRAAMVMTVWYSLDDRLASVLGNAGLGAIPWEIIAVLSVLTIDVSVSPND